MGKPDILLRGDAKNRAQALDPAPEVGWYLLGLIGVAFAVVALADLVLVWLPLNLKDAEWVFGAVSSVLNSLPLFVMGLGLAMCGAVARGRLGSVRFYAVVFGLLALLVVVMAVRYGLTIPEAFAGLKDPALQPGLSRSIAKTLTQATMYAVGSSWVAIAGWRQTTGG